MKRREFLISTIAAAFPVSSSATPAAQFIDATRESRITFRNRASHTSQKYLPESMGAGVAMLDYDGDGWLDLYFVNGALFKDPMPAGASPDKSDPSCWNRLYHNNRDGTFTDVTERAGVKGVGYGMGVAVADYDNDGRPDLYVTGLGGNTLYHNHGDGTFTDVTSHAAVSGSGWCTGACWMDYDRDGWLDLIVARYLDWDFSRSVWCGDNEPGGRSYCHPDHFKPITHLVFHNNRDGTFSDVSRTCGIGSVPGKGLGVAVIDFDDDGWSDVIIANDSAPQQLFRNRGDGTFEEIGAETGIAFDDDGRTFAGMGVDVADYDNDGLPDIFIDDLGNQKYALFRNRNKTFDYMSGDTGISRATILHSGWGAGFVDVDNDGWKDLFIAQGHVMDNIESTQPSLRYREPLLLLKNVRGRFEDVSAGSGDVFRIPLAGRGAAFGDLNNDGLIDVAVNCNDGPALILRNATTTANHWLAVDTAGTVSNKDGIGAKVKVVSASGLTQRAMVTTAYSYLSASDKRVHFGLGPDKRVKLLEIEWPSGIVQRLENVRADQILRVVEPRK